MPAEIATEGLSRKVTGADKKQVPEEKQLWCSQSVASLTSDLSRPIWSGRGAGRERWWSLREATASQLFRSLYPIHVALL